MAQQATADALAAGFDMHLVKPPAPDNSEAVIPVFEELPAGSTVQSDSGACDGDIFERHYRLRMRRSFAM